MADPTPAQISRVRLLAIGDANDPDTLPDDTIRALWDEDGEGSTYLTAAAACDHLANHAARHFQWSADGSTMNLAQRQVQYRDNAKSLRSRYYGSGTLSLGRSEDIEDAERTEYSH